MLTGSFPIKCKRMLARDVFGIFASRVGLIFDVTDPAYWVQTWQRSQSCFHDFEMSNFDKQNEKLDEKLLFVYCCSVSVLLFEPVVLPRFGNKFEINSELNSLT